jgi:hypothetical protein
MAAVVVWVRLRFYVELLTACQLDAEQSMDAARTGPSGSCRVTALVRL